MPTLPSICRDDLAVILGDNLRLAGLVWDSLESASKEPWVCLVDSSVPAALQRMLLTAARDFSTHKEGERFLRLVCDGPLDPDEPYQDYVATSGSLSDKEASTVVEFIHSVMVTRFKGEIAELLALPSAIQLVRERFATELQMGSLHLYWGDAVRQGSTKAGNAHHLKGADGLLLDFYKGDEPPVVRAIFEVKSVRRSRAELEEQLRSNLARLIKGVSLSSNGNTTRHDAVLADDALLVAITPNTQKLSRRFMFRKTPDGGQSLYPEPPDEDYPPATPAYREGALQRVRLRVSYEELDEAAFEMVQWYMGRAGEVGLDGSPSRARDHTMTASEDGRNRAKHMLYLLALRPLTDRLRQLTAKLYNVSAYGYALGIDSRAMIWPEDFFIPPGTEIGKAPRLRAQPGPRTFEFDMPDSWKHFQIEHEEENGTWLATRVLTGLMKNREYEVGYHVGMSKAASAHARVANQLTDRWIALREQPKRKADDAPSPFPDDPFILRREIGSARIRANSAGKAKLAFRFDVATVQEDVRRLIAALVPATVDESETA